MTKSHRTYVLMGNLYLKYFGKVTADSFYPDGQDFDIEVYDAVISEAKIVERRAIEAISGEARIVSLSIPNSIVIHPSDNQDQLVISGREVFLINPKMDLVSEEGLETFGELTCPVYFEVDSSSFGYNPVQLPGSQSNAVFPGFQQIVPQVETADSFRNGNWFWDLLTSLFLFFAVAATALLSAAFFSLFPPVILLIFLGIAITWGIWAYLLPQGFRNATGRILAPVIRVAVGLFSLLFFLLILYQVLPLMPGAWAFGLILVVLFSVTSYLLSNWRSTLYWAIGIGAVLWLLYVPIGWSSQEWDPRDVENQSYEPVVTPDPDNKVAEVKQEGTDTLRNTVTWFGPNQESLSVQFDLYQNDLERSRTKREAINQVIQRNQDYGYIFQRVLENEEKQIESFLWGLDSMRRAENMTDTYFQDAIMHLVQQIPYVQVLSTSCLNVHFDCVPDVKYGFYTPTEFLYHLRGDCDTKSLLLFSIFDYFDFDIALMGSLVYQHAMVAVSSEKRNLDYPIRIGNEVYYPWESTTIGWEIGQMPPTVRRLNYWDVLLITN